MMIMENPHLTNRITDNKGLSWLIEYSDADSFEDLPQERIKQTYGVCFYGDKLVIGFGGQKKGWGLIGGSVEEGETLEQTLRREIQEESNMEILAFLPIGYQKVISVETGKIIYQLRYACNVRPLGDFVIDGGDGMSEKGITEIKLIEPLAYREYFDWGEIGDRIIKRGLKMKEKFLK
jgi:ADP-ribose pyrophosphatase YjhB (NUDIX family)